ncbi:hypothetical protein HA49_06385 [Tatumella morbirosei]|uniref:Uncharacterized protein n=1 Tax=Tatumella morbirosei TaxID=642227 RepID=A0A095TEE4_9GAMM|nr:hypothetical protein HA49_06385 [Tatumella morbirosei]
MSGCTKAQHGENSPANNVRYLAVNLVQFGMTDISKIRTVSVFTHAQQAATGWLHRMVKNGVFRQVP